VFVIPEWFYQESKCLKTNTPGCLIKALRHDGGGGFPIEDFGNDK
jgi:hypothetical protein